MKRNLIIEIFEPKINYGFYYQNKAGRNYVCKDMIRAVFNGELPKKIKLKISAREFPGSYPVLFERFGETVYYDTDIYLGSVLLGPLEDRIKKWIKTPYWETVDCFFSMEEIKD